MLHLLYLIAFTILAVLAIANLVRNLISLGIETRRGNSRDVSTTKQARRVPHPELLDGNGNDLDEPLLEMRYNYIKDASEQLDAIYDSSFSCALEDKSDD